MGDLFHSTGISIHFSMFLTFVQTQASDEQQKAWLGRARCRPLLVRQLGSS